MRKKVVALLFYLISSSLFALESLVICYDSPLKMSQAVEKLKIILTREESYESIGKGNCLSLQIVSDREDLIFRFMGRNLYPTQIYGSSGLSQDSSKQECQINIEKTSLENLSTEEIQLMKAGRLSVEKVNAQKKITAHLLLTENLPGTLTYERDDYVVVCKSRGQQYELSFYLRSINENKRNSLSSSVRINKGEKKEIGSILKEVNEKTSNVAIPNGLEYKKREGIESEYITIQVN